MLHTVDTVIWSLKICLSSLTTLKKRSFSGPLKEGCRRWSKGISWSHSAPRHMHTLRLYSNNFLLSERVSVPTDLEIQGILREHRSVVLCKADATQRINVCRSQLLNDSFVAFSRPTFDPTCRLWMKVVQCVNTSVYSHSHCLWLAVSFKCLQVDFSQCTTFLLWARIHTNCAGRH